MKITQEMRSKVEPPTMRPAVDGKQNFDRLVQSQSLKLKQDGLEKLVEDIGKQGNKLARFRTFKELTKFKRMVKSFLQDTVYNGLGLKKSSSFSFDGQHSMLQIVEEVDAKLMELTEHVMGSEKRSVDLLDLIGEIKGLLINLYT